ncbi:MAG: hypothetical protein LKJ43_04955 [Lentilactobacillus buchneri]|jgi:hypothetical protein|nr:hypothetical protein [Lentilactobacillus buchneri]MCI1951065.1 hypothetical protein [Lentilactobacillus buchneri]MCI2019508.1 hypothetical protein [Lentilactobacillus buchneri]MCI2028572.1 hypothetical protein [Lentilactobacillus buchneri]
MLVSLESSIYKTAIVTQREGIFLTADSTNSLIATLVKNHSYGSPYTKEHFANFSGIYEYVPYVFGDLSLAPLKVTNGTRNASWIQTGLIDYSAPHDKASDAKIFFKDVNQPITIPYSLDFIARRMEDVDKVRQLIAVMYQQLMNVLCPSYSTYDDTIIEINKRIIMPFKQFVTIQEYHSICKTIGIPVTESDERKWCLEHIHYYDKSKRNLKLKFPLRYHVNAY